MNTVVNHMDMENTEDCEWIDECVMCLNKSVAHICNDCKGILLKNGVINVNTIDDYEHYYLPQVDDHIKRKISQQIAQKNY